jgi:hypothetical protein
MVLYRDIGNVKGVGRVVEAQGNFYDVLRAFDRDGAKLITERQEAIARMKTADAEAIGRSYGTWTTAGFEYAPKQMPLMRIRSRLLNPELAKQAVEANSRGEYFSTESTREYEQSLKQAEKDKDKEPSKRTVMAMPLRDSFDITRKNLDILEFALRNKDLAKGYFEFNGAVPMKVYLIDKNTVDTQDGTILTQAWFSSLDYRSNLNGNCRDLSSDYRVRGVSVTGEASRAEISRTSRKTGKSELYTPTDLKEAEREIKRLSGMLRPEQFEHIQGLIAKLKGK